MIIQIKVIELHISDKMRKISSRTSEEHSDNLYNDRLDSKKMNAIT